MLEEEVKERHAFELKEYVTSLESAMPQKNKDSGQILNLKKIMTSLAKQEKFMEAHQVQQQSLQLESEAF